MKRNEKRGFTLAEILITLGVIGVIAALTIPQIVDHTMKAKIEGNLARAVAQIELGCQNMIQTANDKSEDGSLHKVLSTINGELGFSSSLGSIVYSGTFRKGHAYLGLQEIEIDTDDFIKIKKFNGTELTGSDKIALDINYTYQPKYLLSKTSAHVSLGLGGLTSSNNNTVWDEQLPITSVLIDANGFDKAPNSFGKDLFEFTLLNSGKLKPVGDKEDCKLGDVGTGRACAARVVADGFKINYW